MSSSQLYDQNVQELFNYGMQLCGDCKTVKESLRKLFVSIRDESERFVADESVEFELFKRFRKLLLETAASEGPSIGMLYVSGSWRLSKREREATFLKLQCGFTYEEVAAIMILKIESVYTLVFHAFDSLQEQMNKPPLTKAISKQLNSL